jgi:hypothetical protein
MTAPTTAPMTAPMTASTTARQAARAGWLRWRWILAVALAVTLAALVTALTAGVPGDKARLGPDNPEPDGARALVRILQGQDVDVQVKHRSAAAVAATTAGSTLVVTDTSLLGPGQLEQLEQDDARNLVLIEPDEFTLSRLAPAVRTAGHTDAAVREPGCSTPAAQAAGPTRAGGYLYGLTPSASPTPAEVCYPEPGQDVGSYLSLATATRTVTVIGQSDLLTNEYLDQDGNAALAIWALGEQSSLVWYTPDPLEPAGSGAPTPSLIDLVPDWVMAVLLQLGLVVVVVLLWRSRRLGGLVPEPLPVVVRAAETQEGRARLYRQASARGRAAATLRTATLRRLAERLAAPSGTTPDQLLDLVATATGRNPAAAAGLRTLLLGPAPESDSALIRLADDLDSVEREITRDRPVRST